MADEKINVAALEDVINKLRDIEGVYKSLVEKMAKIQFESSEVGLSIVEKKLGKPVANASDNAKLVGEVVQQLEIEKNNIANEGK